MALDGAIRDGGGGGGENKQWLDVVALAIE